MTRFYCGVGSRETPAEVQAEMADLAAALASAGFALRSGGADGADLAFETGCDRVNGPKCIFIPWKGFNQSTSTLVGVTQEALDMAQTVHPSWYRLQDGARKLHARNCYQVLGRSLDVPAELTICWTADGCESRKQRTAQTGGTATAIVLSERHSVPVFNLKNSASRHRLNSWLSAQGIAYQLRAQEEPVRPQQDSLF